MLAPIRHRGPDGDGIAIMGDLALGHIRLSVIDLQGGAQPRQEGRTSLVFNGEIYGYQALARALLSEGHTLRDSSDTEVLFTLLKTRGVAETLDHVDGMYSFAFRGEDGVLHLVRDRFGEKPLFYAVTVRGIVFGSEILALRQHPWVSHDLDVEALGQYLTLQYMPGELTGFSAIKRLPAGTRLEWDGHSASLHSYWSPHPKQREGLGDQQERIERLDALLSESVRARLVADVPVGVFLSGGLDSSLVAAYARYHARDITAFSVRLPGNGFDESPYAVEVAQALDLKHEIVSLEDEDLKSAFEAVVGRLDEFLADSSLLPTYLVCRAARGAVTVALGGDGADELFAGYPNFKLARYTGAMAAIPRFTGTALRKAIQMAPAGNGYMNRLFLARQLSYGLGHPPEVQSDLWMAAFSPEEQRRLWKGSQGLMETTDTLIQRARVLAGNGDSYGLSEMMQQFLRGYLPDNILVKVDRASMYNSLEVRSPFLGRDLAEFSLSLPPGDKFSEGEAKVLLRRIAARMVPHSVVQRPKHGFAAPMATLLREQLRRPAEEILLSSGRTDDLLDRTVVEKLWKEHQSRRRDHHRKLWSLLVLKKVAA